MGKKPVIGITPGFANDKNKLYIGKGYVDGVIKAGGLAVLLPLSTDEAVLDELMAMCNGFLLAGGPDVDARHFGEVNCRYTGEISPFRDTMELYVAKSAVELGKPVLGICRGCQLLNVAFGGTLYQDIYSQVKDRELLKHSQEAPDWYPVHDVGIEKDSKLWNCYGMDCIGVNSFHHQAVKDPGKSLKVVSRSSDSLIEAVEHENHIFAVGVQWHPELMWQQDGGSLRLFEAFVEAAALG